MNPISVISSCFLAVYYLPLLFVCVLVFKNPGDEIFPVLFFHRFKGFNIEPLNTPSLCFSQVLALLFSVLRASKRSKYKAKRLVNIIYPTHCVGYDTLSGGLGHCSKRFHHSPEQGKIIIRVEQQ
jgi:hypothetical protein